MSQRMNLLGYFLLSDMLHRNPSIVKKYVRVARSLARSDTLYRHLDVIRGFPHQNKQVRIKKLVYKYMFH